MPPFQFFYARLVHSQSLFVMVEFGVTLSLTVAKQLYAGLKGGIFIAQYISDLISQGVERQLHYDLLVQVYIYYSLRLLRAYKYMYITNNSI